MSFLSQYKDSEIFRKKGDYCRDEENYDVMKKYYLMAIDLGNIHAMNNLGVYYHVIEKNYESAKYCYSMARRLNDNEY